MLSSCKTIVRSELILNIKRIRDCLVRVLLTNTRTGLPYNELEIFNTALSYRSLYGRHVRVFVNKTLTTVSNPRLVKVM